VLVVSVVAADLGAARSAEQGGRGVLRRGKGPQKGLDHVTGPVPGPAEAVLPAVQGGEDALLAVAALLVGNAPLIELLPVTVGNAAAVGEKDPEPLFFGKNRRAVAADSAAQYDDVFHCYLIFSVTSVMAASSSEMIQKRMAILVSNWPFIW
jgi:hypothetical protein